MVEKNCSCQPKKLMVALAQGVAPSQYGRRGGWTGMDLAQLQTRLGQLGVRPKDEYRAALYIDHLADAQTYFQTTLAGPVGAVPPGMNSSFHRAREAAYDRVIPICGRRLKQRQMRSD